MMHGNTKIKNQYTYLIISLSVFLRMRNVSFEMCRENQNVQIVVGNFFFSLNRAVCEIMWKNMLEQDRVQMAIWRMRIACSITTAKVTHTLIIIWHYNPLWVFTFSAKSLPSSPILSSFFPVYIFGFLGLP